jgi:excisionase family DNA binding protein
MPAILQRHVSYGHGPLLGDGEMTTREASELSGVGAECIRRWVTKHRIGAWNRRLGMYVVNKQKLEGYLARRKKAVA